MFSDTYLVFRKCEDIGQLLAPPYFIEERFVTGIFTGITVQPPLLSGRIDFCPDMVCSGTPEQQGEESLQNQNDFQ